MLYARIINVTPSSCRFFQLRRILLYLVGPTHRTHVEHYCAIGKFCDYMYISYSHKIWTFSVFKPYNRNNTSHDVSHAQATGSYFDGQIPATPSLCPKKTDLKQQVYDLMKNSCARISANHATPVCSHGKPDTCMHACTRFTKPG
jgi:hypothetical protein